MIRSEEFDLRDGLVYDVAVKGYDSNFWQGDTANGTVDTVTQAIRIGDTGLVGSMSSFSQYLYGDFEFAMLFDSESPDSNDSEKFMGLRNLGDTLNRGAAFFDLSYDTTVGDSSANTRPFSAVIFDEVGNRQRKDITWDTNWSGGGRLTKFRIKWEPTGVTFLVNDTVEATLSDRTGVGATTGQLNTSIPQGIRISNRSLDTTDTAPTKLKLLTIRNARKII